MNVQEFATAAELRAHYAAVRARMRNTRIHAPVVIKKQEAVFVLDNSMMVHAHEMIDHAGDNITFRMSEIMEAVVAVTGIAAHVITSRSRMHKIVTARHLVTWFCAGFSKQTFSAIGRFVGTDHSTVISGIKTIDRNKAKNAGTIVSISNWLGCDAPEQVYFSGPPHPVQMWTPEQEQELLDHMKQGMAMKQIAHMMGRGTGALVARMKWMRRANSHAFRT